MENVGISNDGLNDGFSLKTICYKHIKDTFYYGIFGDFKIVIDKYTGYFNATKLCLIDGKEYKRWSRLEKSKNILDYYQKNWNTYLPNFYEVKGTCDDNLEKKITGIYIPKELILDVASQVSPKFYDRCNKIIINYFVEEFKTMDTSKIKEKIKEIEELNINVEKLTLKKEEKPIVPEKQYTINDLKHLIMKHNYEWKKERDKDRQYMRSLGISLEEVKDHSEELISDNKEFKLKLGLISKSRTPQPGSKVKIERFVLLKRNDLNYMMYYVIRSQNLYVTNKLKTERIHFPHSKVLLDFKCNPNSKTLYKLVKEKLQFKGVVFNGNNIDLDETITTEQDLIDEMKVLGDY